MKKIFAMVLCLFVVIMGIGCVYSANLAAHDFGSFTMNVPSDSAFEESNVTNFQVSSNDPNNASNTHPGWEDKKNGIVIEYFNYTEDNITGEDVQLGYLNNPTIDDLNTDGYKIFKDGDMYILIKVNGGHKASIDNAIDEGGSGLVILKGKDVNSLKEMIGTLKFK